MYYDLEKKITAKDAQEMDIDEEERERDKEEGRHRCCDGERQDQRDTSQG